MAKNTITYDNVFDKDAMKFKVPELPLNQMIPMPMVFEIKFEKVRNVKTPQYGTDGSAGIDFFIPDDIGWDTNTLWPGASVNVPSGIKLELPPGIALIALNKSSLGSKGLNCGAVLCDPDYRGELHLNVFNVSEDKITIHKGTKLIQFIAVPFFKLQLNESRIKSTTSRGEKGFGSTGSR